MPATNLKIDISNTFRTASVTSGDISGFGGDAQDQKKINQIRRRAVNALHTTSNAETKPLAYISTLIGDVHDLSHPYLAEDKPMFPKIEILSFDVEGSWGTGSSLVGGLSTILFLDEDKIGNDSFGRKRLTPSLRENNEIWLTLSGNYSFDHYLDISNDQENYRVNVLLNKFKKSDFIRDDYKEQLVQRMYDLRNWGVEDNEPIKSESLSNFYSFMKSNMKVGYPSLALSPSGLIVALWLDKKKQRLSLEFLPGNEVAFVVFARDPKTTAFSRFSGNAPAQSILKHLSGLKINEWLEQYVLE